MIRMTLVNADFSFICGFEYNVSAVIGSTALTLGTAIFVPQMMTPNHVATTTA